MERERNNAHHKKSTAIRKLHWHRVSKIYQFSSPFVGFRFQFLLNNIDVSDTMSLIYNSAWVFKERQTVTETELNDHLRLTLGSDFSRQEGPSNRSLSPTARTSNRSLSQPARTVQTCILADSRDSVEVPLRCYPPLSPWSLGSVQIPTLDARYSKLCFTSHKTFDAVSLNFGVPTLCNHNLYYQNFPFKCASLHCTMG